MTEKMKAAGLHAPFDLKIKEVEKPKPRSGEVLRAHSKELNKGGTTVW